MTDVDQAEPWTSNALLVGFTLIQAARAGGLPLVRVVLMRMQLDLAIERMELAGH